MSLRFMGEGREGRMKREWEVEMKARFLRLVKVVFWSDWIEFD